MRSIDAIIFDFDGVLSPTDQRQHRWFQHWARQNNKEFPKELTNFEKWKKWYNKKIIKGPQKVYDSLDLPCDMNNPNHKVWPAYEKYCFEHPAGFYNCIKEVIQEIKKLGDLPEEAILNKRLSLAINSTNTWKNIRFELKTGDLLSLFDGYITKEILRNYQGCGKANDLQKPSPISLALCLEMLGCEASRCLHIGDTCNDLIASHNIVRNNPAKKESLITIGATWGFEGEALKKGAELPTGEHVEFDYIAQKPSQLLGIVKKYL